MVHNGIELLPEKAVFIQEVKTLVIADLHFGKVNHFRQAGLPVPPAANHKNAETLIDLLNATRPDRTVFLGDLFHSHYNEEWEVVGQILSNFPACRFDLVIGNHDIMSRRQYHRKGISVLAQEQIGSWLLTHEPLDPPTIPSGSVNMAGHLHPGAHLQGRGRQSVTLPCFWFSAKQLILPAFGSFTGLAPIRAAEGDAVFIIIENKVHEAPMVPGKKRSNAV